MTDDLLEIRNLCGVPVLGKHSIGMYGVNYHNVVEAHFWELDTKEDTRIAFLMREWVGESPRGIGKNLLRAWCPYSITDIQHFLFLDRVEDRDPIFLHSSELECVADSWKTCITDANCWNRKHKVFLRLSTRLDACGSDFLLMRQPLAKLLWEKLYAWGNTALPNMCVRSNGTLTTMVESNEVWERLTSKLDVEAVLATNLDRVATAREYIASHPGVLADCQPDFRSPRVATKFVDKNGRDQVQYEQYEEIMKAMEDFINNPKSQTQNYALDA